MLRSKVMRGGRHQRRHVRKPMQIRRVYEMLPELALHKRWHCYMQHIDFQRLPGVGRGGDGVSSFGVAPGTARVARPAARSAEPAPGRHRPTAAARPTPPPAAPLAGSARVGELIRDDPEARASAALLTNTNTGCRGPLPQQRRSACVHAAEAPRPSGRQWGLASLVTGSSRYSLWAMPDRGPAARCSPSACRSDHRRN